MNSGRHYDVTADGERFLLLADQRTVGGEETLREMTVVLNWVEELKRLVPTN